MRRASPVFLARRAYRIRRRRDAVRLLPFAGIFLLLLPLLWSPGAGAGNPTASDGIYFFVIWGLLILAAGWLSRGLSQGDDLMPEPARPGDVARPAGDSRRVPAQPRATQGPPREASSPAGPPDDETG